MTGKERCLAVIEGRPADRTPVFPLLMFFAIDRAGLTYKQFATNGDALAEAQIAVAERFGIDAITVCSDAYRISGDLAPRMGGGVVFPEKTPPHLAAPLVASAADADRLCDLRPDPTESGSRMADRVRGIEVMARATGEERLVLGWIDMPFAEACAVCGVNAMMLMLVDDPETAHRVLDHMTELTIAFALAQGAAGAPMIGAGDAAASLISPDMFAEFALPYEQRVCAALHDAGLMVKLHICGNTTTLLGEMAGSGADLYNVDHLVDFDLACEVYGDADVAFKGNLNPVADIMQASPDACREKALSCIDRAEGLRYMLSAGCEIPAETPDEVFAAFCEAPLARA